jgi:hypothetical protein
VDDAQLGRVKVTRWSQFHFRQSAQRTMEILRVEVIEPKGRKRPFKPLWLAWVGLTMPMLAGLWRKYLRGFSLEHWYRFAFATVILDTTTVEFYPGKPTLERLDGADELAVVVCSL